MKLPSTLLLFALSVASAFSSPTPLTTAPNASSDPDPVDRLTALRAQLTQLESPLISTYLSRASLNASLPRELTALRDFFSHLDAEFPDPVDDVYGTSSAPFPPTTNFALPAVLPPDAVLDEPVVGKGIFPTGRRPQDPWTPIDFLNSRLWNFEPTKGLNAESLLLLDATLLQMLSGRVMLGRQVALAKFDWTKDNFCNIFTEHNVSKKRIQEELTDRKQEVRVLGRIKGKAEALSEIFFEGKAGVGAAKDALRLFQAYIIPLTTEVEVRTILAQKPRCQDRKGDKEISINV